MHDSECPVTDLAKRAAIGALSGLAGTTAIWLAQSATKKWLPQASEPMRVEPGEYIVNRAHKLIPARHWKYIPRSAEKTAAAGSSFLYGGFFGALYGVLRPRQSSTVLDGMALGLTCWAAGYLGWLPAAGILPPLWKQKPAQIAGPIAQHAIYGVAAAEAYDLIEQHV